MNASWMFYATCVALLLAAAATVLERPLRDRVVATRIVWVVMLVGALAWPAAIAMLSRPAASATLPPAYRSFDQSAAPNVAPVHLAPAVALPAIVPASSNLDLVAQLMMVIAPAVVLAILLLELTRLARARRRWRAGFIDGQPVLISADFGPAIVGVWRPQIVVPAWALELRADQRALMMAHESEHLDHRDSRWLGAAFLAVLIAPWNIGLWWLLRRFRIAMELDCDQRVLRRGYDVAAYGELLLEIGRRSNGRSLLAAGFAERRSMLRTRIDSMTATASRTHRWRVALGAALLFGACMLGPSHDSPKRDVKSGTTTGTRMLTMPLPPTGRMKLPMPRRVAAALNRFPPPTNGAPSIATRFTADKARIGDQVELVTVTWFPRVLRDSLRHLAGVTGTTFTGDPEIHDWQLPTLMRTSNVGGKLFDMYVSWSPITPRHAGRIEARPATLSYRVPRRPTFLPATDEPFAVQSSPAVLVVQPE